MATLVITRWQWDLYGFFFSTEYDSLMETPSFNLMENPSYIYIYIFMGKFHHDQTQFSRSLVHHGFVGKSSPNGGTIQVSELL